MENIVILANIEWNFLKQRHQFLAENLCKRGYNVLFVESAAKRNPGIKDIPRIINRIKRNLFSNQSKKTDSFNENFNILSPIVFPSTNKFFRFLNNSLFIPLLNRKISKCLIKSQSTKVIWYAPTSTTSSLIKKMKPQVTIYDCVSNFEAFTEMPKDTTKIEDELIVQSDCMVVDCDFLYSKHCSKTNNIFLIEPAVDFDLFSEISKEEMEYKIEKVVYYGQLDSLKINIGLINYLIENGIDVHVIGKVTCHSSEIKAVIHETVDINQLPELLREYDALLLPYNLNDYTAGIIPAKFFECFATGLPIIATNLLNFKRFQKKMICGDNNEEILNNIKTFTFNFGKEERIQIAKDHSWEKFTDKFTDILNP